ncbi:MAG TPA: cyclase family protein [Terriglobales bacterium]|nr:cyclase family protein [Terriglobales bacterium]
MIIDLSHRLEPGMPSYPGLPIPKFHTFLAHGEAASYAHYAAGTSFQIACYELSGNTGTYVDAPFHRHPSGPDLADVPLERLVNLPGTVISSPSNGPINAARFKGHELGQKAVLVSTGWDHRWTAKDYFRSGPFLTADACEYLVNAQVALVGIDCANIDNMDDPVRPAHTILLAAGIAIVEHLRSLDQLAGRSFRFFAAPPAIRGGTSFPVRAFAVCD